MADAYQTKFNYTPGGEFVLSGSSYVGMFNVYGDGTVYTGRYRDVNSNSLEINSNYSADMHASEHQRDLNAFDTFALPHQRNKIQIDLNETVNFTTINSKIKFLHENQLYLYSKLFIGDTDVPYAYDRTAAISSLSGQYGWWSTPNYYSLGYDLFATYAGTSSEFAQYTQMDSMKRFVIIPFENASGFGIIGITNTHVIGLTSNADLTEISLPLLYTNVIDNYSDERCQNLTDLTFDGKYLYVTDSAINSGGQVFKYDVTTYRTGDAAFLSNRFLIKPLGGLGGRDNNIKFKGCGVIGSKANMIYVADQGNGAVKVYDDNLVWLKTIILPRGDYTVADIRYRKLNNSMYFLVRNNATNKYIMYRYDSNNRLRETFRLKDDLYAETDGEFRRMAFSEQDSNVFYLITKSTVYKKFFSRPETTFAVFKRDKFGQSPIFKWNFENIRWGFDTKLWNLTEKYDADTYLNFGDIAVMPSNNDVDGLFVLGNGVIFHFSEVTNYQSVLDDTIINYYNLQKTSLEYTENVQSLTINKELYKIYSNIIQLKNNIRGRFSFEYDGYGNLDYRTYMYFIENELERVKINLNLDSQINANELVQAGTMNKIFNKLYDVQDALLELVKPHILNFRNIVTDDNILLIE